MRNFMSISWPTSEQKRLQQVVTVHDQGLQDMTPVWESPDDNQSVAEVIRNRARLSFVRMESPDGKKWAPLSLKYIFRKAGFKIGKGGKKTKLAKGLTFNSIARAEKILDDTGQLRRAATRRGDPGQFVKASPRSMVFTVTRMAGAFNVGAIHQTGGQYTPQRQWFGLRIPDDLRLLRFKIIAYLMHLKGMATAITGSWSYK